MLSSIFGCSNYGMLIRRPLAAQLSYLSINILGQGSPRASRASRPGTQAYGNQAVALVLVTDLWVPFSSSWSPPPDSGDQCPVSKTHQKSTSSQNLPKSLKLNPKASPSSILEHFGNRFGNHFQRFFATLPKKAKNKQTL